MKPKRSKFQIFALIVFALFAIHFLFFRAPSEAQMVAKFHQRKAEFEQIRLMLAQDKNVETIGRDWITAKYSEEKDGVEQRRLTIDISQNRLDLYRSRLKKLGFSRVDSYKGRVQLEEFGGGFTDTTWGIGYVWSAKPLAPLVKSAYSQMPERDKRHFSRIEGNWYLYHRR